MGAVQLVCNSGPLCIADIAKTFFFSLSPSKQGSFHVFLDFPLLSTIFLPSCRLPFLFCPLSQVFHVI